MEVLNTTMIDPTKKRKESHLEIALKKEVECEKLTGFEDVHLLHNSLPDVSLEEIDLSTKITNHKLSAPMLIESMTGGTEKARKVNSNLAMVAEELNIAIGVGSQRAAIENPKLIDTFKIVRQKAPTAFIFANIGAPQLIKGYGIEKIQEAIEMIDANALFIHLNPLQEVIQFEGDTDFRGISFKIGTICDSLKIPVFVKETGAGVSMEVAKILEKTGVTGINVAGYGGTNWAYVEYYRAMEKKDKLRKRLGKIFMDWGIPTAVSVFEVSKSTKLTIIASGGIRNGLHIAKSLALGANLAGMALPLLRSASKGVNSLKNSLLYTIEELRTAMFLTGVKKIEEMRKVPVIITGTTGEWLIHRGFDLKSFSKVK